MVDFFRRVYSNPLVVVGVVWIVYSLAGVFVGASEMWWGLGGVAVGVLFILLAVQKNRS